MQDRPRRIAGGRFGIVTIGADYVLNPRLLVGTLVQIDNMRQRSASLETDVGGSGWMAGPYATLRLSENVFLQGRAAWGKSSNDVSPYLTYTDRFDSTRWLASMIRRHAPHVLGRAIERQEIVLEDFDTLQAGCG